MLLAASSSGSSTTVAARDAGGSAPTDPVPQTTASTTRSFESRGVPATAGPPCPSDQAEPAWVNGSFCGPAPTAGNGLGPDGLCTGKETSPPCGPGAVPGKYYAYTLPLHCDGRTIFDGQKWVSQLPPSSDLPPIHVWMGRVTATQAGFIAPNGSVGFSLDTGAPPAPCRSKP